MDKFNEYTAPSLTPQYVDTYLHRRAILDGINKALPHFYGSLLDVGCGHMPYKDLILSHSKVTDYVGMDFEANHIYKNSPDITWDGVSIPLEENSMNCAIATEVLEHCPDPENVLGEIFRVLKPDGVFFFTVPFLWPIHDAPHDQYRYTPFSLARHLETVGFANVNLTAMGGWDESLAQMIGLYARRRPMRKSLRIFASALAVPFVAFLEEKGMSRICQT